MPVTWKTGRWLPATLLTALVACSDPAPEPAPEEATQTAPESLGLGVDLDNMDRSIEPQEDFFQYMNGGWLAETEIPDDRSRWGSFDALNERAEEQVLALVQDVANTPGHVPGSDEQKVADMYRSFMGQPIIETMGLQPLEEALAAIDDLQGHDELPVFWSRQITQRVTTPLTFGVNQDPGQSDRYVTVLNQSGLGLPDREYYLSEDERFVTLRGQYREHIARMLSLAEISDPDEAATAILDIETRLAESHWTRAENRDRTATYNLMTVEELAQDTPDFDWRTFLNDAGLEEARDVVVRQPDYLAAVASLYRDVPVEQWQDYQRFHLLRRYADYLPPRFVEENFSFYGRILRGQPEMQSRERRAIDAVESALGFMVGRLYVNEHFQQESRERMEDLVDNLLVAFEDAIDGLEWMGEETRAEAQAKLDNLTTKIGHPNEDAWRDYSCVAIAADDLVGNIQRSTECDWERIRDRLGQPVDREEWFMTPQTVNAYYSPSNNEIVFPAAILQPPFFNVEAEDAVNYGAIGGVIGHEITHAFDDQGRRSDGEGNLRDWWTEADAERFNERAQQMVDQYDGYEPLPGLFIQGDVALGENIADLGGLTVAYQAWEHSLEEESAPVIEGFSGAQRFFMGWGQVWRIKYRDEALQQQLMTGPHSPGEYRVIGVLSNMPEFYEAFDVDEGDGMYLPPEERVKIW